MLYGDEGICRTVVREGLAIVRVLLIYTDSHIQHRHEGILRNGGLTGGCNQIILANEINVVTVVVDSGLWVPMTGFLKAGRHQIPSFLAVSSCKKGVGCFYRCG